MKLIDTTHISKYCSSLDSSKIITMISRRITCETGVSYSRVVRENGTIYYSKRTYACLVDIEKAIEVVSKIECNIGRSKYFDYDEVLDILDKVLKDRLTYGDIIPDTSDTFKDMYIKNYVPRPKPKRKHKVTKSLKRKERQESFIKKFNNYKFIF